MRPSATGSQLVDELWVERRLGLEVEVGEALEDRKTRELQVEGDGALVTLIQLAVEQIAEEVAVAPLFGGGALRRLVESGLRDAEAEAAEPAVGFGFEEGGAHPATSA